VFINDVSTATLLRLLVSLQANDTAFKESKTRPGGRTQNWIDKGPLI